MLDEKEISRDTLLRGRVTLLQPRSGYRSSLDPVLLAGFVGSPCGHFLDLGCGTGALSFLLLARDQRATGGGVELQPRLAALAERGCVENGFESRFRVLAGDVREEALVPDASFDLVSLANSLHHLENIPAVFSELLRVLKPGGRLLILEMYRDGGQTEPQQTHIMMHHWLAAIDRRAGVHHLDTFTREEIRAIYAKLKLKQTQVSDFYLPVDNPKDARLCEGLTKNCQATLKRLEGMDGAQELLDEGKRLLERIEGVGFASASSLMLTGIKPKQK